MTGRPLPFPDAVPLGARFREGVLALECDEQLFHLDVRTTADRSDPEEDGPWGKQLPEYSYRYRGHALSGTLLVQPRPPRLRAKCSSEVFVASGRAAVETHLLVEAEVGRPDTIDLLLSESDGEPWQWQNESARRDGASSGNLVRRAERLYAVEAAGALHGLAARTPLQAAILLAARPVGERWRLTLARPLRTREPLRLRAMRPLRPRDERWHVPLPVVLGAGRMEGEVTLHLAGADLVQIQTVGLRETAPAASDGPTPWRTFRYGQAEVALTLWGQTLTAGHASEAAIDRARLTTYVGAGGVVQHHFSFQVANWAQRTLPLRLPPHCRPVAVQADGHWLPLLVSSAPVPDRSDSSDSGDAEELNLPVPGRDGATAAETVHRFDIVYTHAPPSWRPWQSVAAPAPVLPVTPLSFRRSWRLPPNWRPLHDGSYQPLPGTDSEGEPSALPRHVSDLFQLPGVGPQFDPLLEDSHAGARDALAKATEALRGSRAGRTLPLREVVSEIAFTYLKDRYPLIVDVLALREAGVGLDTRLTIQALSANDSPPPWEACGLVAVPARASVLLTTATGHGAALREPLSASVERALTAAVARGQDSSGRFRSALNWLRPENAVIAAPAPPHLLAFGADAAHWGEWEPAAGLSDDTLIVVRRDLVTAAGLGLVLLEGLFFWIFRRRSVRWRLTFLLLVLGLTGVGVLWLPAALRDLAWWPLLAGCLGLFVWYVRTIARQAGNPKSEIRNPKSAVAGAATAVVLFLAGINWGGRAAAPAPVTVYLVPGPAGDRDNQSVLAPADLLDRLKALARPAPLVAGGPAAVLLDAVYEGKLVDGQAEFTAVFSVHCLSDEPAALALPLDGVQFVGDVWLDGSRADLLALSAPRAGYSLSGARSRQAQGRAALPRPVVGTPEDRNVLFTVPPLPRTRLSWHVPPGASYTQALVKRGAEWTVREGAGERLEVDLGLLETPVQLPTPLHLHWHQAAQPDRPARVQYRAAYLWDLNPGDLSGKASVLTAWLRYRVLRGAVRTLEVDLPADLDARSADVQRIAPASSSVPAWLARLHLRDWHVRTAGDKRTLHLELPYPVAGDFQVILELVPRAPLPALVTLSLPAPHGERGPGSDYLAYRTHPGLEAQRDTSQNITRIGEGEFAPDWPSVPRLPPFHLPPFRGGQGGAPPTRSTPSVPPVLRLHLRRGPSVVQAELDITVQAGPHQAEVQAAAELKAPNKDLGLVEWDLPSARLTVASVSGDDVRAWKQTDRRLLVWLHRTTAATRVSLSGWLPLEGRGGQTQFDLPCLRLVQAREQHTRLRLVAAAGLTLASVSPHNLQPVTAPSVASAAADHERTFETRQTSYGGSCEIATAANAVARVLTFAEVADRRLQFTTTVNYEVSHGELRRVHLRLRNWEAEKVELQADRVALRRGPRRTPGDRSWLLDLQPGVTGRYRVTLRGSMPVEEAAVGVPLPDVSVSGVERAEYVLAVAGGELTSEARGSLVRLARPAQALAPWPGVAQRVERTERTELAGTGAGVAAASAAARPRRGVGAGARLPAGAVGRRGGRPALAARDTLLAAARGAHRPQRGLRGFRPRRRRRRRWRRGHALAAGVVAPVAASARPGRRPLRPPALVV